MFAAMTFKLFGSLAPFVQISPNIPSLNSYAAAKYKRLKVDVVKHQEIPRYSGLCMPCKKARYALSMLIYLMVQQGKALPKQKDYESLTVWELLLITWNASCWANRPVYHKALRWVVPGYDIFFALKLISYWEKETLYDFQCQYNYSQWTKHRISNYSQSTELINILTLPASLIHLNVTKVRNIRFSDFNKSCNRNFYGSWKYYLLY